MTNFTTRRSRSRGALVFLAVCAAMAGVTPFAHAQKYYDTTIGTQSASSTGTPPTPAGTAYGGTFSSSNTGVGDVAVNDPSIVSDGVGQAGWIYVADRGNNRIQAFDENRNFKWAIGRDVIAARIDEHQDLTVSPSVGGACVAPAPNCGQFKLEFNGQATADLPWNATPAAVQTALRGLSTITGTNVNVVGSAAAVAATGVTPGSYVISFVGALGAADQPAVTVQPGTAPLAGATSVTTVANGTNAVPGDLGDAVEKCTVAVRCKAGTTGTATDGPGGEFNVLAGIDVDQATGHLFVGERGSANARVQQLSGDGEFIRAFGWDVVDDGPANVGFETCNAAEGDLCKAGVAAPAATNLGGVNPGQFGSSTAPSRGLAVAPPGAPNAGQVYVADPGSCRVQRFTVPAGGTGSVTAGTPFGAVPQSGNPFADDVFCATTGLPPTITVTPGWPLDIATDAQGVVYASVGSGSGGGMVKRFDTASTAAGSFQPTIAVGGATNQLGDSGGAVTGLAVDPANDHLLIARSAALGIVELDLTDMPSTVSPDNIVNRHLVGLGAAPLGLGAGGGRYFIPSSTTVAGTGTGHRVLLLDDDGVEPDPLVEINPATQVEATTATFSGRVDPILTSVFRTSYRWEISKDGVTWDAISSDAQVGGNGFTPQNVTVAAHGLEPNTLYRVRIRTSRAPAAGVSFSAEMLVHTDSMPPTVETRPAQHVSDSGAQLVGSLNPGGLGTTYWFEWGDDNYGQQIPVVPATATGAIARNVAERLGGLAPDRLYHYRLCARNGLTPQEVCGADRLFVTRSAASAPPGRTYEIVTAPDKSSRRGASLTEAGFDFSRLQSGVGAVDGGAFAASYFAQPADPEAGYGQALFDASFEYRRRQPSGWNGQAIFNVSPLKPSTVTPLTDISWSRDLRVSGWGTNTAPMVGESALSIRRIDDTGGPRGAGWYAWLDRSFAGEDSLEESFFWVARFGDDGERVIAESLANLTPMFRDVTPADGGSAPEQLTPPQTDGPAIFVGDSEHDWRPVDLVNECTGSGSSSTLVPARDDAGTVSGPTGSFNASNATMQEGSPIVTLIGTPTGMAVGHFIFGPGIPPGARVEAIGSPGDFDVVEVTISVPAQSDQSFVTVTGGQDVGALADDRISPRLCSEGSPTDFRGAQIAATGRLAGSSAMTMSDGGRRIFFVTPAASVSKGQAGCDVGDSSTGAATACPAQLFVRQYDDEGNPTVRWLSRPEDALLEDVSGHPQMRPAALGSGVSFEGASRDGSVVYFRTDAPLTFDDPNGGLDPRFAASPNSWDLYRYDLGPNTNADPGAGDSGPRLTRVSGGPQASADPNTNCVIIATSGPQNGNCWGTPNSGAGNTAPNGEGGAVRFLSDDGDRVYFVTAARIPGADNSTPDGGATGPSDVGDQTNVGTRNLYLYDADRSGAAAYKFIARIPFSVTASTLNSCASSASGVIGPQATAGAEGLLSTARRGCVHGSGSGDAIVFPSAAQLTGDDNDSVGDVYLYDATADSLTRLSSPGPEDRPYACSHQRRSGVGERCNGDLGFATGNVHPNSGPGMAGQRHWNVAQDEHGRLTDVYFQTRLPLVPGDRNASSSEVSGGMDVYRWRRADGRLSLVSPGTEDDRPSFYGGNSLDGSDVFFWTEQRLSPWEIDAGDGDIYNATTRPPIPPPPPPPVLCDVLAQGCQPGGAEPVHTTARTAEPVPEDRATPKRWSFSLAKPSRADRARAARTGVLRLRATADAPGKLTAVAVAVGRTGKRAQRLARASVELRKAGSARLSLKLNRAARARLSRRGSLRLSIRVTAPGARARTMNVLLKRSKSS